MVKPGICKVHSPEFGRNMEEIMEEINSSRDNTIIVDVDTLLTYTQQVYTQQFIVRSNH